jgi:putative peptidoglycan lipid II flippase
VATDSRFVRVLDAVQSTDPGLGSYIVCEYTTGQSLEMILSHAPLSGLEAAWVIREVADALAGVHSLGLYHQRINPDTVIITPTGNVKIVGLLIEAALRPADATPVHGADTPELVDVTDLGRLLYACLVSRWPGGPAFSLPDAPVLGRRWGTPRQVRAGVSPSLDNVCDQILGDPPRHRGHPITTAHGVVNALTKVLGSADASGDLERRLKQPIPQVGGRSERIDTVTGAPPVSSLMDQPTEPMLIGRADDRPPAQLPPPHRPAAAAAPRQPSTTKPIGPAAAGESGVSTVIRHPAGPGSPKSGQRRTNRARARQPRRWIGLLIVLVLLLVSAGVISARLLDRRITAGAPPVTSTEPSAGPSTSGPPSITGPLNIAGARSFDPEGDEPKTENPDEVKLAFDGDRRTRWRTVQYIGSPQLGGIKRGVGLIFDLGSAQPVRTVELALSGTGTNVEFRVPSKDPSGVTKPPMGSDKSWRTVAKQSKAGSTATLTAAEPVTTRYVLVYLTSLPKEGRGYRGGIYEAEVRQ